MSKNEGCFLQTLNCGCIVIVLAVLAVVVFVVMVG